MVIRIREKDDLASENIYALIKFYLWKYNKDQNKNCTSSVVSSNYYSFLYNPISSPNPRICPPIAFSRSALLELPGISSLQSSAYTLKK